MIENKINEFVNDAMNGRLKIIGITSKSKLYSEVVTIVPTLENITAEAFNQDLFPIDYKWEDGLAIIKRVMENA